MHWPCSCKLLTRCMRRADKPMLDVGTTDLSESIHEPPECMHWEACHDDAARLRAVGALLLQPLRGQACCLSVQVAGNVHLSGCQGPCLWTCETRRGMHSLVCLCTLHCLPTDAQVKLAAYKTLHRPCCTYIGESKGQQPGLMLVFDCLTHHSLSK